jgi:hypothetical protein
MTPPAELNDGSAASINGGVVPSHIVARDHCSGEWMYPEGA